MKLEDVTGGPEIRRFADILASTFKEAGMVEAADATKGAADQWERESLAAIKQSTTRRRRGR